MTGWLERALFARRRVTLAAFAALSIAMALSAFQLRIDAGFTKLAPLQHPYMKTFLDHREEFGGADRIVLALIARDGEMFTPEYLDALHSATDAVFFLPGVDRTQVFSILTPNVRFVEVVEDGIAGGNVLPSDFVPDEAGLQRLRENIVKAGLVGRLVANDLSGAIVAARLQEFHPDTGERLDYVEVAHELERIRERTLEAADGTLDVHIIGFAKAVGDIADGAGTVAAFFAIAFLVAALLVLAYTRSAGATVALLGCSLLAVVWQLGLLSLLGYGIDPLSILVPFLIFAIGVSHGVQVVGATHEASTVGIAPLDAAKAGFRRLLRPGIAALASDAAGFGTIALIQVQAIQEVAVAAGLGVATIVLTNLGLLPILLSFARKPPRPPRALPQAIRSVLARAAHRKPAAAIICAWAGLVLLGATYAVDVRIGDEQRGVPELRPDSVYNRDADAIGERFDIGVDVLTVIAETAAEGCIDFETMRTLDDFEWTMSNVEGVVSVAGLAGAARRLNAAWNEGNLKWQTLPRNRYSLVQSVSPVPTSSGLLNSDCSVMPVHIYTADHRAETIQRIVDAVKSFDASKAGGPISFRLAASNVGVMAATNEEVDAAQFPIVGYVYAAVILLVLLAFRSLRSVLCIILPLAAVSVLAYALMALIGIGLKVSTLPVVALGVGVGVDYGIYIFGRIRNHLRDGIPFAEAYEHALRTAGAGVMLTGLTLAAGVATWVAAPLQFQADMGTVLMFMFLVNMAGA
ncbi:MAG: MMPL family transporter, partial [Boseongicola sp. SB0662_bin_57]|nr:MMPL family transporter [Boseongicola sp. SB0662_bin_57]